MSYLAFSVWLSPLLIMKISWCCCGHQGPHFSCQGCLNVAEVSRGLRPSFSSVPVASSHSWLPILSPPFSLTMVVEYGIHQNHLGGLPKLQLPNPQWVRTLVGSGQHAFLTCFPGNSGAFHYLTTTCIDFWSAHWFLPFPRGLRSTILAEGSTFFPGLLLTLGLAQVSFWASPNCILKLLYTQIHVRSGQWEL